MDIKILYQDTEFLVIDKPAGLVCIPIEKGKIKTLADILTESYDIKLDRGGLVHRLDKDTSGLILAAKNLDCFNSLQKQFKERKVKKEYLALTHGWIEESGKIEAKIGRNPKNREKFTVLEEGREAVTEFEPLKKLQITNDRLQILFPDFSKIQMKKLFTVQYPLFTLLRCLPKTGRTHQIRVHLKYLGHPIVGDEKYGGRKVVRLDARFCLRQFLHAAKISFIHPKTLEQMSFESPLPDDLEKVLHTLEM